MLNRLSKLLNIDGIVEEDLIKKGISKIDPRLKNFISNAAKHGFSFGSALSFLKSQISGSGVSEQERSRRPDELAQRTIKSQEEFPSRIGKSLASAGLGGALGGIGGAVLGSLGENSPVKPSLTEMGPESQEQSPPQYDPLQVIAQKYPELAKFIQMEAQAGSDAALIAKKARSHPRAQKYGPMIDSIERMIDEPFETLLARLLGQSQTRQQQQSQNPDASALLQALGQLRELRARR